MKMCPKCFSYHASVGLEIKNPDPSVRITEYKGIEPSYMVVSNMRNTISNCIEIMNLLNEQDQLPAWASEMVSFMKLSSTKVLDFIRSQKSR